MRYLIIDAEGDALIDRAGVRVQEFSSNPTLEDECAKCARPRTEDMEAAIGALVDRDKGVWNGSREFIVVPLEGAFVAHAKKVSSVSVASTGGRPK